MERELRQPPPRRSRPRKHHPQRVLKNGVSARMARIKLAYIGGGSTRAAGTMASFVEQGEQFNGSEVVLIDLDADHLAVVRAISEKMARAKGLDLTITSTTDRRTGLQDCDAV